MSPMLGLAFWVVWGHNGGVKNRALLLVGLFLFGVYALPGKVCPTSEGTRTSPVADASDGAVPPCHRRAETNTSPSVPCEKMVCCLVPDAARGFASPILVPRSENVSFLSCLIEAPLSFGESLLQSVPFSAQAPPGEIGFLSLSSSPRGPPVS